MTLWIMGLGVLISDTTDRKPVPLAVAAPGAE